MRSTYKSFDALFSAILTAYQNAGISSSITVGDELYVRAAGLASLVWGAHRETDWTENQIWPDTASQANITHHASLYGITQNDGESYADFLKRLLKRIRNKVSGGNLTDYETWAMECSYGTEAPSSVKGYSGDDAYGPGTCVLLVSEADDATPSAGLLAVIKAYVLEQGPVVPAEIYVIAPTSTSIAIALTMTGGDAALAKSLISSFMAALEAGQTVYQEVFVAFCYQAGASSVTLTSPTTTTAPSKFGKVAASSIVVTAA